MVALKPGAFIGAGDCAQCSHEQLFAEQHISRGKVAVLHHDHIVIFRF